MAEQTSTLRDNLLNPPPEQTLDSTPAGAGSEPAPLDESMKRRTALWRLLIVGLLLLFVWFLAVGLYRQNTSAQRAAGPAPQFEFTTFDGETVSLADLKGKGVVLNFWASWCDPCRDEAALLEAASQRESANGVVFLGLDYLDQEHSARAYLTEFGITYPNGPDAQSEVARRYGIQGVPETFFIDPNGNITDLVIGPVPSEAAMEGYLAKIRPAE